MMMMMMFSSKYVVSQCSGWRAVVQIPINCCSHVVICEDGKNRDCSGDKISYFIKKGWRRDVATPPPSGISTADSRLNIGGKTIAVGLGRKSPIPTSRTEEAGPDARMAAPSPDSEAEG